ncbi:hypothetical protein Nepgr_030661 [Nepenthes gracilis]|uniref:Probable purine permease n=1 Tax=Nepenthes gracilis TaxID=150966 RepID=A0AAD3TF74_NEPGR|nr:hypothetical protein Nepgr_030661 [Nepenthes gracilis]
MEADLQLCQQNTATETKSSSTEDDKVASNVVGHNHRHKLINYKWWLRVTIYIVFLLAGQTAAILLGRLYYDKGGNSTWMATFVQTAGFPVLIPFLPYFSRPMDSSLPSSSASTSIPKLALLYLSLGLLLTGDDLMYSYGLLYIPVSTYSLLCASQLAFNAVFAFFLNAQKFTALILNSLVLLTISSALLGVNSDSDSSNTISRSKYTIGFLCTVGASAVYSLYLSLVQLCFEKVMKRKTFGIVLNMQVYPQFVSTCSCVVGLFVSGQWRGLREEMRNYQMGRVSYIMTLVWTALTWQISSLGLLGLIFEVSSLFSNMISTLGLPMVPVFAVVFFHDKMNGVKAIALLLAVWGFLSYIYQQYLDDAKGKEVKAIDNDSSPPTAVETC